MMTISVIVVLLIKQMASGEILLLVWLFVAESTLSENCSDILCESKDYKPNTCSTDGIIQSITISKQISNSQCKENHSFSYVGKEIHVSEGCRAHFKVCFEVNAETVSTRVVTTSTAKQVVTYTSTTNPNENTTVKVTETSTTRIVTTSKAKKFVTYTSTKTNGNTTVKDNTDLNYVAYVLVPLAVSVLVAIAIAVFCIKRRRHKKNIPDGLRTSNNQHKQSAVATVPCNEQMVKYTSQPYYTTLQPLEQVDSAYDDIERTGQDKRQQDYSHLKIQTLPCFDNTYSHLKADHAGCISDMTYSHLDNEKSLAEIDDTDFTYNRLQVVMDKSNEMKITQSDSVGDVMYSHLVAGGKTMQIDSDEYSHLNYKSEGKKHFQCECSGITYEQATVDIDPEGEDIRHDYFVLEKIS